jgi:D-amino-acid dehydrogenase
VPALSAGLKGLAGKGGGFVFADHRNPDFWRWALRFARECTPSREEANTRAKNQLCLYSQQLWSETYQDTGLDAPRKQEGVLYLYRDAKALARAARMSRIMRQNGQVVEVLDAAATLRTEPGLAVLSEGLAGALHAPGDASGSCHVFSTALLAHLTARGLDARFRTRVLGLVEQGGRITGVWTDAGGLDADAVVVALGPEAAPFLAQHGVRVPVYPVKGYSLHVEGVDGNGGPRLDGVDKAAGIAWRRQGREVRLTTGAVFAGHDRSLDLAAIAALRAFGERLFGPSGQVGSGDWARVAADEAMSTDAAISPTMPPEIVRRRDVEGVRAAGSLMTAPLCSWKREWRPSCSGNARERTAAAAVSLGASVRFA